MKNRRSYIIFSLAIGGLLCQNVQAQIIKVVESLNISTGAHIYCTPGTLISPSIPSHPVTFSGTSEVDYMAGHEVQLLDGFSSHPTGAGYFHASNPIGYDILMEPQNGQVPQFDKVEFSIKLPATIRQLIQDFITVGSILNPFNPEDMSVEATFTSPITHQDHKVYGFYNIDYTYATPNSTSYNPDDITAYNLNLNDSSDSLTRWAPLFSDYNYKVRFAPDEIGMWKCSIVIKYNDPSVQALMQEPEHSICDINFYCNASTNKGYVTVGNNGYLKFSKNNESFFPIGAYMGWANYRGSYYNSIDPVIAPRGRGVRPCEYYDFMQLLEHVKNNGGNYARLIITPDSWGIEWEDLGNYTKRLPYAWELDKVVEWAEQNDMYLNIAMNHSKTVIDFDMEGNSNIFYEATWNDSPYKQTIAPNEADPSRFFTETDPKKQYKKYLRYFLARWGYSTHIAKLELGNELSSGGDYYGGTNGCFTYDPYVARMNNSTCTLPTENLPSNFQYQPNLSIPPDPWGYRSLLHSSVTGNTMAKDYQYWNNEMAAYIKNDLEARQMINVSYPLPSSVLPQSDDLTNLDANISTICAHSYLTEFNVNLLRANSLKAYKNAFLQKPFMFEEIDHAFVLIGPAPNECNDVTMHNSSWAMCFTGAFGTAPTVVPGPSGRTVTDITAGFFQDNVPAITSFFSGIDFELYDYVAYTEPSGSDDNQLTTTIHDQPLEKFILSSDDQAMGWIHLRRWYWAIPDNDVGNSCQYMENGYHYYHVLDPDSGATPPPVSNQILTISVGHNHNLYKIDWYDTRTGSIIPSLSTSNYVNMFGPQEVTFIIPPLGAPVNDPPNGSISYRPDIAFKVYPFVEDEFRSQHISIIEGISLMPNPNHGEFMISIQSTVNAHPSLYLIDLSGRIIHTQYISIQEGLTQIPMSKTELSAGVYFIKVDGFDEQLKMIVTK